MHRVGPHRRVVATEPAYGLEPGAHVLVDGEPGVVTHFEPYTERPYRVEVFGKYRDEHEPDYGRQVCLPHKAMKPNLTPVGALIVRLHGHAELVPPSSAIPGEMRDGSFVECGEPDDRDDSPVPWCMGRAVGRECTCHRFLRSRVAPAPTSSPLGRPGPVETYWRAWKADQKLAEEDRRRVNTRWGSAQHHRRELAVYTGRKRCPYCKGEKRRRPRATHAGQCNGMTLTIGCEWHMRLWCKDGSP